VDVSNPANPTTLNSFSVYGNSFGVSATEDLVAVSASYGGVNFFDAHNPTSWQPLGRIDTYAANDTNAFDVVLDETTLYITVNRSNGWSGLWIYDVSHPSSPSFLSQLEGIGYLGRITLLYDRAYIMDNSMPGVRILDISNPRAPELIGQVQLSRLSVNINVAELPDGTIVLGAAQGTSGYIEFHDVTDAINPFFLSEISLHNQISYVTFHGNKAYLSYMGAIQVIDFTDPLQPTLNAFVPVPIGGSTRETIYADGYLYTGIKGGTLAIFKD
jgi:hypothetical protein